MLGTRYERRAALMTDKHPGPLPGGLMCQVRAGRIGNVLAGVLAPWATGLVDC
jgi:hypothetical protein